MVDRRVYHCGAEEDEQRERAKPGQGEDVGRDTTCIVLSAGRYETSKFPLGRSCVERNEKDASYNGRTVAVTALPIQTIKNTNRIPASCTMDNEFRPVVAKRTLNCRLVGVGRSGHNLLTQEGRLSIISTTASKTQAE